MQCLKVQLSDLTKQLFRVRHRRRPSVAYQSGRFKKKKKQQFENLTFHRELPLELYKHSSSKNRATVNTSTSGESAGNKNKLRKKTLTHKHAHKNTHTAANWQQSFTVGIVLCLSLWHPHYNHQHSEIDVHSRDPGISGGKFGVKIGI